jgi:phosphoribosylaminoimidazole-succinocarboxamide synthase
MDAGELVLIDEVLTPDSSRYWPERGPRPGSNPPSLDKQPVRDWLETLPGLGQAPPPPASRRRWSTATTSRYLEIFRRLTGTELDAFEPPVFAQARP